MSQIDLQTKIGRDPKTASRVIDDEAIVLTPMDSKIHSVNEVGTRIWELLADKPSLNDIVTTLCSEFDVDNDTAKKDAVDFIENLIERGMAEVITE